MASITKLVTALMILDQMPLTPGESGPSFTFTSRDRQSYYDYLAKDESALNVPVGGSLTQYQMLQGMLIGSAGNYTDRLVSTIWPNDRVFAAAARRGSRSTTSPGSRSSNRPASTPRTPPTRHPSSPSPAWRSPNP
jgi:hypothetical protein